MGSEEVTEDRFAEVRDRVLWLRRSLASSGIAPKPFVQVFSPLRGKGATVVERAADYERNRAYLDRCLHDSILRGEVPFAPHKCYPGALDDLIEEERKLGIECGLFVMARADYVVAYLDRGTSDGMKQEIEHATKLGIAVVERQIDGDPSALSVKESPSQSSANPSATPAPTASTTANHVSTCS